MVRSFHIGYIKFFLKRIESVCVEVDLQGYCV